MNQVLDVLILEIFFAETNFAPSLFTPSGTVKGRPRGRRKKVQNLEGLAAAPVGVEEDSGERFWKSMSRRCTMSSRNEEIV